MLTTILSGGVVALLTGLFGWLAAKATGSSQVDAKKVETVGPQWQAFSQLIMERMDAQQAEIDGLKKEMNALREKFDSLAQKYWRAVQALRRVFTTHPHTVETAALPEDVHEDVFGE